MTRRMIVLLLLLTLCGCIRIRHRVDSYNAQAIEQCKKQHPDSQCTVLTYPSCERTEGVCVPVAPERTQ